MMTIAVAKKNVHSVGLFETIDNHVRAVVLLLDLASDMGGVSDLLDMLLSEEAENSNLEQTNVIADFRNNKLSDNKTGKFTIDLYYRQKNCYNTTRLTYTLQK